MTISRKLSIKLLVAALAMATFNVYQLDAMKRPTLGDLDGQPTKRCCVDNQQATDPSQYPELMQHPEGILATISNLLSQGESEQDIVACVCLSLNGAQQSLCNIFNYGKCTALHLACATNNTFAVKILLQVAGNQAGNLIYQQDSWGRSSFDLVVNKNTAIVNLFALYLG